MKRIIAAVMPAVMLVMLAYGCQTPPPGKEASPIQKGVIVTQAAFVGNDACAECHRRAFEEHRLSRHALTMRSGDVASLAQLAPKAGKIGDSGYSIQHEAGKLVFTRDDGSESAEIQRVFGSGKSGMTFTGKFTSDRMTEFRLSYIPNSKTWYITPGQEGQGDMKLGIDHVRGMATRCVTCHATHSASGSPLPAPEAFGVGCESCHGPGGDHVTAAKSKASDLKIEFMSKWDTPKLEALCAKCHRSANDVSMVTRDASSTARFQPYGLEMSPCFRKSNGKLNCMTCHDAHGDRKPNLAIYEKTCISCHSPTPTVETRGTPDKPQICPINQKDRCIGCHMPQRQVFSGSKLPLTMADHLIWAYRPLRGATRN
jgi:hypothetical protein